MSIRGLLHKMCALSVLTVLVVFFASCSDNNSKLTVRDVMGLSSEDIEVVMVSPIIDYRENWHVNTAEGVWATVDISADVENIFNAVANISIESTDGSFDVTIAGECPRYVAFVLRDNTQTILRFVDDTQVWINGVAYNFSDGQSVYSKLDSVLEGYSYNAKSGD